MKVQKTISFQLPSWATEHLVKAPCRKLSLSCPVPQVIRLNDVNERINEEGAGYVFWGLKRKWESIYFVINFDFIKPMWFCNDNPGGEGCPMLADGISVKMPPTEWTRQKMLLTRTVYFFMSAIKLWSGIWKHQLCAAVLSHGATTYQVHFANALPHGYWEISPPHVTRRKRLQLDLVWEGTSIEYWTRLAAFVLIVILLSTNALSTCTYIDVFWPYDQSHNRCGEFCWKNYCRSLPPPVIS